MPGTYHSQTTETPTPVVLRLCAVLAALLLVTTAGCGDDAGDGDGGENNAENNENNENNDRDLFDVPQCNFRDNPEDCEDWICYYEPDGRRCEKTRPDRPDGGGGWECSDDALEGYTVCERTGENGRDDFDGGGPWTCNDDATECSRDDPGGRGNWDCEYDGADLVCTRTDGPDGNPGWTCFDDASGTHCETTDPDLFDDEPTGGGWVCVNDGDTRRCDNPHDGDEPGNASDNPTGGAGWTCEDTNDGRICVYDGPDGEGPNGSDGFDTPDGGAWVCVIEADVRTCEAIPGGGFDDPEGNGDRWDCTYDPDRDVTVCVGEPDTPTPESGWECVEEADRRICFNADPGDPGGPGGGPCGDVEGNVQGRVCAPSGDFWVAGADVSVTFTNCQGESVTVSTQSDSEGYFFLQGVGVGNQTITVSRGPFETSYDVEVEAGETFTIPLGDFCFDQSTNIAVVTGQYDRIGVVLEELGFTYDAFDGYPSNDGARALLADLDQLNMYDAVFINCGVTLAPGIITDRATLAAIRQALQTYVQNGGRLYVSDWAYLFAEEPFPDAVDFHGTDGAQADVLLGATGYRPARIINPELAAVLGEDRVTLHFDYPNWAVADAVGNGVETYIEADIQTVQGEILRDAPILVRWEEGDGVVLFTSYHVHQNQSLTDIFFWIVFAL